MQELKELAAGALPHLATIRSVFDQTTGNRATHAKMDEAHLYLKHLIEKVIKHDSNSGTNPSSCSGPV